MSSPFLNLVLTSDHSPTLHPSPFTDLAGRTQDSPDAVARGEGLQQLLIVRDPTDRLRGLRLRQRSAVPVASRHWLHLPDQQQRLPLGALCTHTDEMMMWTPLPLAPTHAPPPRSPALMDSGDRWTDRSSSYTVTLPGTLGLKLLTFQRLLTNKNKTKRKVFSPLILYVSECKVFGGTAKCHGIRCQTT